MCRREASKLQESFWLEMEVAKEGQFTKRKKKKCQTVSVPGQVIGDQWWQGRLGKKVPQGQFQTEFGFSV